MSIILEKCPDLPENVAFLLRSRRWLCAVALHLTKIQVVGYAFQTPEADYELYCFSR